VAFFLGQCYKRCCYKIDSLFQKKKKERKLSLVWLISSVLFVHLSGIGTPANDNHIEHQQIYTLLTAIFILIDQNLQNSYSHFCLLLEQNQTEVCTLVTFVTCLWNTSTMTTNHHYNARKLATYTRCCKAAVGCYVHTWHDIKGHSASDRIQPLNSQSSSSALGTHRLCHSKTS
jgi:hypothetical protein